MSLHVLLVHPSCIHSVHYPAWACCREEHTNQCMLDYRSRAASRSHEFKLSF